MKLKTLVAGILMAATTPLAMAAENVGPYIGGNFGRTSIDAGTVVQTTARGIVALGYSSALVTMEQSSTGFKFLGGYQVNENLAVEGYYADLGKYHFTASTTGPVVNVADDLKATAIGMDLLGMFPFNSEVSGIGRIGFFRGEGKFLSATTTGTDFKIGLGVEWKLSHQLRLRAEWERYNDKDLPLHMLSAGIVAHF